MKQVPRLALALIVAAGTASQAAASRRPCLDAHGKVIPCAKPKTPASPRCKDEKGRFAGCHASASPPATDRH